MIHNIYSHEKFLLPRIGTARFTKGIYATIGTQD